MPSNHRPWAGASDELSRYVTTDSRKTLGAYRKQPTLIREHANHEKDTARGGYSHRQLFELAQNSADALTGTSEGGRIAILLTESHLYCADDGRPIDEEGVTALKFSYLSPKRGTAEIGRFGLGFKSVLGVSEAPEFFSRTGSFRFDPDRARRRILAGVPRATMFPTLRLPEPIDPQDCRDGDSVLAELMEWANNIVRLPLTDGARPGLESQIQAFPGQFLLFVEHVRSLSLRDAPTGVLRRFEVERRDGEHVLSDGNGASRWRVFTHRQTLSDAARADSRSLDDARECLIRWAAPLGKASDAGYFWTFFPTRTASLVSGILNAPWKTNEDRQNLLSGAYNDELIEGAATLVAESLPELATDQDPGRHLDALPRKEEPGDSDHSKHLRARLLAKVSELPVVPGQDGVLRQVQKLRYPPMAMTTGGRHWDREAFDRWAKYPRRPGNWAHNRAINPGRLAKIARLFEVLPRQRWEPTALPQATIAEWLEVLVKGRPQDELAEASIAAVQTAALIPHSTRPRKPADFGRIVLAANGTLQVPDPQAMFLPDPASVRVGVSSSKSEIHASLARDAGTEEALRELGIAAASPESYFADVASIALDADVDATDPTWVAFWGHSRNLTAGDAERIIRRSGLVRMPHVLTLAGDWMPLHWVLLPGPIVDASGSEDIGVTVDTDWHDEDLDLLQRLGVGSEPRKQRDLSAEPWFHEFRQARRDEFKSRQLPTVRSTPQEIRLVFDSTSGSGPLDVLRRLSPVGAARYTAALLLLDSTYPPWTMRHESQAIYPALTCDSPAVVMLLQHGWVDTAAGPVPLRNALGSQPQSTAGFCALVNHPKALRIKDAFELAEPDPVFTDEADPVPLVDVWPGLRGHLRDDQATIALRLCDDISVVGRERRCVLHGGDVYLGAGVEDESEQLRLVAERLALRLDPGQLEFILQRRTEREVEERRTAVKEATTNADRLLRAVGMANLRVGLGESTLDILELERGTLTGVQVAEAVIATHHTDSLRQFKWALDHLDPPKQWAGSSAAVTFVKSLGFSREWAGQRGKRRASYLEVHGPFRLPPLHGYQETIVNNVRSLLRGDDRFGTSRRGMISLPTGSGKTRVAVQALVEATCKDSFRGSVLWVADRDELCEQAVESWRQVWSSIGTPETLRVSRMWGGQRNPERLDSPHVVVATIQTLDARLNSPGPVDDFLGEIGIIVFDEAHRSIAPTFTSVTQELGLTRWQRSREPFMIGLTATPYRGYNEAETARLARRYAGNRLDRGAFLSDDAEYVVKELQEGRILAEVNYGTIEGGDFTLSDAEVDGMADTPWLPKRAQESLARDANRTRRILRAYEEYIHPDWPALVFATSVEHAGIVAALLSARGIRATAVSGKTETATRRRVVEEFRNGDIQVLVNYEVFREGFDAPRTRAIVVARPVYSPNLYFQMIGRGMRGIKNGGNDRCLVLNVRDNIRNFNRALAFAELDWLWAGGDGLKGGIS